MKTRKKWLRKTTAICTAALLGTAAIPSTAFAADSYASIEKDAWAKKVTEMASSYATSIEESQSLMSGMQSDMILKFEDSGRSLLGFVAPFDVSWLDNITLSNDISFTEGKEERELDLKDEDIISRLESTKNLKSSSPSTGEFLLALEKLFSEGYEDIIIMTMSKENSTTYNVANMAIDSLDDDQKNHVYNVDTNINNYGITNILIALSYWRDKDISGKDLAAKANIYCHDSHLAFTLLDLVHLFRGGRLSKISCAIGLLFKIKPVIEMIDGKLELTKKERITPKIISYFMNFIEEYSKKYKKVYLRFAYLGPNKENIDKMEKMVKEKYQNISISTIDRVGPVFLVHLGNDGFGISITGVDDQ